MNFDTFTDNTDTETLIEVDDLCSILHTNKNAIYRLAKEGKLPAMRLDGCRKWLFPLSAINQYIHSCGNYRANVN